MSNVIQLPQNRVTITVDGKAHSYTITEIERIVCDGDPLPPDEVLRVIIGEWLLNLIGGESA